MHVEALWPSSGQPVGGETWQLAEIVSVSKLTPCPVPSGHDPEGRRASLACRSRHGWRPLPGNLHAVAAESHRNLRSLRPDCNHLCEVAAEESLLNCIPYIQYNHAALMHKLLLIINESAKWVRTEETTITYKYILFLSTKDYKLIILNTVSSLQ